MKEAYLDIQSPKILIIDDHSIVVNGCSTLLKQNGFDSLLVSTDCDEGLKLILNEKPDVAIIDISMPGMGGLGIIRRVFQKKLATKVIIFSMHDDVSIISRALDIGVHGYVSKISAPSVLVDAIQTVLSGELYLSHDVAQSLALNKQNLAHHPFESLSKREFEIFDLLVNGKNIMDIAKTLNLSSKSIRNYITKIKCKLNVSNLAELVHLGYKYNVAQTN